MVGRPHRLVNVTGETVVIQTGRGRHIFRKTCVKQYTRSTILATLSTPAQDRYATTAQHKRKTSKKETDAGAFAKSRREALNGLVDDGTFIPLPRSYMPEDKPIFRS